MSKLSKMITATLTGDAKATRSLDLKYLTSDVNISELCTAGELLSQVRLSVSLVKDLYIRESHLRNDDRYSV